MSSSHLAAHRPLIAGYFVSKCLRGSQLYGCGRDIGCGSCIELPFPKLFHGIKIGIEIEMATLIKRAMFMRLLFLMQVMMAMMLAMMMVVGMAGMIILMAATARAKVRLLRKSPLPLISKRLQSRLPKTYPNLMGQLI